VGTGADKIRHVNGVPLVIYDRNGGTATISPTVRDEELEAGGKR
jgi:hypothetical protein